MKEKLQAIIEKYSFKRIVATLIVIALVIGATGFFFGRKSNAGQIKSCQKVINEIYDVLLYDSDVDPDTKDELKACDSSFD